MRFFFLGEEESRRRVWSRNYVWDGCLFRSKHIGQNLPVASVVAHESQISLSHLSHSLSPDVGFPQISHGCSTISIVISALALWSLSIPMVFTRSARLKSFASTH